MASSGVESSWLTASTDSPIGGHTIRETRTERRGRTTGDDGRQSDRRALDGSSAVGQHFEGHAQQQHDGEDRRNGPAVRAHDAHREKQAQDRGRREPNLLAPPDCSI
jgi:hypothetical protein